MLKRLPVFACCLLLVLLSSTVSAQQSDTIRGKFTMSFSMDAKDWTFDGFYGINDWTPQRFIDSLQSFYLKGKEKKPRAANRLKEKYIADYQLLSQAKLLYSPCEHIYTTEKKVLRIYFSKKDYKKVMEAPWFPDYKMYNIRTNITLVASKVGGNTYRCNSIISIEKSEGIPRPVEK